MQLPDLSNLMYVARLRYIQSLHEPPEHRNPDRLVRHFIPVLARWRLALLGRKKLAQLRADPFYYYLLARTNYYDQLVQDAVADGVQRLICVGCGSDTRSYRLSDVLCQRGVKVLECDQLQSIAAKQRLAERCWRFEHVQYLPIDLNDGAWPELERWLDEGRGAKVLVMMEGVSPYVESGSFREFLSLLSRRLPESSWVAYDFKLRGIDDRFGQGGGTKNPFRLPGTSAEIQAFHGDLGYGVQHFELSSSLPARLMPALAESTGAPFREDGLVQLRVRKSGQPPEKI